MNLQNKGLKAASADEINTFDRYIKCVVDMIQKNFNGEAESEPLYRAALQGISAFCREHSCASDTDSLAMAAVKSILKKVDAYSGFHPYATGKDIVEKMRGNVDSFGITISRIRGRILVCRVFPFSSAYNEGIQTGDEIVSINGLCVSSFSIESIYDLMNESSSGKAVLEILRDNRKNIFYKETVNEKVKINRIVHTIKNNIGYVRISLFDKSAYEFVHNALAGIDKANVNKIVLDLRNTCGGDIKQAALTAGIFVPAGLIASVKFRSSSYKDIEYYSRLQNPKYRLVVLINEGTVSSSEMLAGAIQDTKSGLLLGTNTRGKASVQKMIPVLTYEAYMRAGKITGEEVVNADELKTKYALKPNTDEILGLATLTVGEFFTPKGRSIAGKGLVPDIFVDTPEYIKNIHYNEIKPINPAFDYIAGDECMEIYYAKEILANAGYRTGKTDLILDEATVSSIMKFQEDHKLYITGKLDIPTQKTLNALLESWIFEEDKQFIKTVEILEQYAWQM